MIERTEFRKLRKWVLEYLKRNAEANGYCNLQHYSLDSAIMYSKDMVPFKGMTAAKREQAIDIFWATLLRSKQVEVIEAPINMEGKMGKHYYLPGTEPFHRETLNIFERLKSVHRD